MPLIGQDQRPGLRQKAQTAWFSFSRFVTFVYIMSGLRYVMSLNVREEVRHQCEHLKASCQCTKL